MKPAMLRNGKIILGLFALLLTIGLVSWDHQQPGRYDQPQNDTVPKKQKLDSDRKIRDLDDVLDELNDANFKVDLEKLRTELNESLKNLNLEKIQLDLEKAMKDVDFGKIQKDLEESMAKLDMNKLKLELNDAMKSVDMEKLQKEIKESMEKVDWNKMTEELNKIKEIDLSKLELDMKKMKEEMSKVKIEMDEIGPRVEKELANAKIDLEKAKEQLKEFKGFVDGLAADGLIDKKAGYTLKHKDGELFINGKKASDQTYNKYKNFLEKHKKFNIEKSDDDFDMDLD